MPNPPMHYIRHYTEEGVRRATAPRPPPPIPDTYSMFGITINNDDAIIQSLESQAREIVIWQLSSSKLNGDSLSVQCPTILLFFQTSLIAKKYFLSNLFPLMDRATRCLSLYFSTDLSEQDPLSYVKSFFENCFNFRLKFVSKDVFYIVFSFLDSIHSVSCFTGSEDSSLVKIILHKVKCKPCVPILTPRFPNSQSYIIVFNGIGKKCMVPVLYNNEILII